MRLFRRLIPQVGYLTAAGLAWNHRGTIVRLVDFARNTPRLVREDGAAGMMRNGRLVYELDRAMPTDTAVRISGVANGSVTLAGDPGPAALARATGALCTVRGVVDVRTDGSNHSTASATATA